MHLLPGKVSQPEGVYPLNGEDRAVRSRADQKTLIYPDFQVWAHSTRDDTVMRNHLQKGYYEPPIVSSECHSGRQNMSQLLNKTANGTESTNAKLSALSDVLIRAIDERRQISKIHTKSTYKPPPRVTLNEHKRELWLQNLANPSVPLRQLARAIPHGLRNRALFEQCMSHHVPIDRALWLVKCVASNEQRQLKRKGARMSSRWVMEWTEQLTGFIEQIYEYCYTHRTGDWKYRLNYTIELATDIYLAKLLNQEAFLAWIIHHLASIATKASDTSLLSLRNLSLHYLVLRLFWFRILQVDYLSKELGESLLLVIEALTNVAVTQKDETLYNKLTANYKTLVRYLFYYNSDNFVLPLNWTHLNPHLKKALNMKISAVAAQFNLVTYRNESLMIDESGRLRDGSAAYYHNRQSELIYHLDNYDQADCQELSDDDSIQCIEKISDSIFESDWHALLDGMLHWAATTDREPRTDFQRICLSCTILQQRLNVLSKRKHPKQAKLELESQITDFVYFMASELSLDQPASLCNFLVLVNKLHELGLFVASTYLRRLIASGLIYLPEPDRSCHIHLLVLHSLPMNDSNASNIIKRLSDTTGTPIPQEAEMLGLSKKHLSKYLDAAFAGTPTDDIVYDMIYNCGWIEPEEPMQIGRKLEVGVWFMDQLERKFNSTDSMTLHASFFDSLWRLTVDHFRQSPRLLKLLFEQLDQGKLDVPQDTFISLIRTTASSRSLVASCLIDQHTCYWHLVTILNSWAKDNRFNIDWILQISGVPFMPSVNTKKGTFYCTLTTEELNQLGIISIERLSNAAEFSHHFNMGMSQYVNTVKGFKTELRGAVVCLLRILQNWKPDEFTTMLSQYLRKYVQPTLSLDYDTNLKLVVRLLTDNLISGTEVSQIFEQHTDDEFSSNSHRRLLWDLYFSQDLDLDDHDYFAMSFERFIYRYTLPKEFYKMLSLYLSRGSNPSSREQSAAQEVTLTGVEEVGPVDMMNLHELGDVSMSEDHKVKEFRIKLSGPMTDAIWYLCSCHMDLFEHIFYSKDTALDTAEVRRLFGEGVLKLKLTGESQTDCELFLQNLNYFNLPVCQWIFQDLVCEDMSKSDSGHEFFGNASKAVRKLLVSISKIEPPQDPYLIGELFEFVPDDYKLKILSACEDMFLGSESFPGFSAEPNGPNMTTYLTSIISICSHLYKYEPGTIPMSDPLVFSLNLSFEKLLSYCHKIERRKTVNSSNVQVLEEAIKLESKIVLIHKNFLVDVITKRSANMQRDVLLVNLMKLFKSKAMEKNPKLKNLLYDILISLKVLMSEAQYQRQQQSQQPQFSPLPRSVQTPSAFSPVDSPMPSTAMPQEKGHGGWMDMVIEPPNVNNKLKFMLAKLNMHDALAEKETNYYMADDATEQISKCRFRSFDMIEDASPHESLNDTSLGLQLFGCSIERQNPP